MQLTVLQRARGDSKGSAIRQALEPNQRQRCEGKGKTQIFPDGDAALWKPGAERRVR